MIIIPILADFINSSDENSPMHSEAIKFDCPFNISNTDDDSDPDCDAGVNDNTELTRKVKTFINFLFVFSSILLGSTQYDIDDDDDGNTPHIHIDIGNVYIGKPLSINAKVHAFNAINSYDK